MSPSFPSVLVIAFNRPDTLRVLLDKLKTLGVFDLYFAVDGPRPGREDDVGKVSATKWLIEEYFSPPDDHCLFGTRNLGVRRGPEAAITWFFTKVQEGVILEDDCIPGESFLPYCAWALDHYRHEPTVMSVSGFNGFGTQPWPETCHLIQTPIIWGWATWRRAWEKYESEMPFATDRLALRDLRKWVKDFPAWDFWHEAARMVLDGRLGAWDVAWGWAVLRNHGLVVFPRCNLVTNIGYGDDATHTAEADDRMGTPTFPLEGPYVAPARLWIDRKLQRTINRREFWRRDDTLVEKLRTLLKRIARRRGGY